MYINFAYYFTKLLFNNTCNYFNHYWKHYCYYKIEFYINLQDQIHSMLQGTTFFSLPQFYWGWEKYIRKTKTQNSKEILIFFSRAFTWIIRGLISMYFTKKKKKKETIMFLQGNWRFYTVSMNSSHWKRSLYLLPLNPDWPGSALINTVQWQWPFVISEAKWQKSLSVWFWEHLC